MSQNAIDTSQPKDRRDQDIFVINDLVLRVAPSAIAVQHENLVYTYKTLRSRSSTKIPTGHGNVLVHVTIPFLNSELLMLHRLIVEYRHSPFCYVENRYLREVVTPHNWPAAKSMAFGISSLQVSPMGGTSDAWVVEMDLLWFNYEPYGFNWLYREDWLTQPLELAAENQVEKTAWCQYGIGWQLDRVTGEKIPKPIIISRTDERPTTPDPRSWEPQGGGAQRWSMLQEHNASNKNRTIYDMQQYHFGAEFDTLPLPGNMEPAKWVVRPLDSRVYVRYINLLQRDALYKNFGIDVEEDIINYGFGSSTALDPYFRIYTDTSGLQRVAPLYGKSLAPELQRKWIDTMLETNGQVDFMYSQYTEVELPEDIREFFAKKSKQKLQQTAERQNLLQRRRTAVPGEGGGNQPGDSDLSLPFTGERRRLNSPYGPRNGKIISSSASSFHRGLDFRGSKGSPLYSPVSGVVATLEDREQVGHGEGKYVVIRGANGEHWYFFHLNYIGVRKGQALKLGEYFGDVGMTGKGRNGTATSNAPHIHIGYSPPGAPLFSSGFVDPAPRLKQLVDDQSYHWWETVSTQTDPLTGNQQSVLSEHDSNEAYEELLKTQTEEQFEATPDQAEALLKFYEEMSEAGWFPYIEDMNVSNVWYRPISFGVINSGHGGFQRVPEQLSDDGIVLTGIAGSMTSILARLPILDHEHPTLQYLGSTEPSYMMEFTVVDDAPDLEGISDRARTLTGMRSELQANARRFRPVVDGWGCATDTFMTRLLGSFFSSHGSFAGGDLYLETSEEGVAQYMRMNRRTAAAYQSAGTIEGQPGLSTIQLELQETNFYQPALLVPQSPARSDVDKDYAQILQRLYNMDLAEEYRDGIASLLIADIAGATDETDARITRNDIFFSSGVAFEDDGFVVAGSDHEMAALEALVRGAVPDYQGENQIFLPFSSLNDIHEGVGAETKGTAATYSAGPGATYYQPSKRIDRSGIKEDNPALAEVPVGKLLDLYGMLRDTVMQGSLQLEENDTGGLSPEVVQSLCFDLPVQQYMWQGWQSYLLETAAQQNAFRHDASYNQSLLTGHKGWRSNWARPIDPQYKKWIESRVNSGQGWLTTNFFGLTQDVYIPDAVLNSALIAGTLIPIAKGAQALKAGWPAARAAITEFVASEATHGGSAAAAAAAAKSAPRALAWTADAGLVFSSYEAQYLNNLVRFYMNNFPLDVKLSNNAYDLSRSWLTNLTILDDSSRTGEENLFSVDVPPMWQELRMHIGPTGLINGRGWLNWRMLSGRPAFEKEGGLSGLIGSALNPVLGTQGNPDGDFYYGDPDPLYHDTKESLKLQRIRQSLSGIAQEVMNEPALMRALGLENLMFTEHHATPPGLEAYPDMDLPPHPYYGDTYAVSPDFYMWNMYEDGGAFKEEQRQLIERSVFATVKRAYDTFSNLRSESPTSKKGREAIQSAYQELGLTRPPGAGTTSYLPVYNAEASDVQVDGTGPGTSWFQPNQSANPDDFKDKAKLSDEDKTRMLSTKPQDYLVAPRVSLTEGNPLAGGGTSWGGGQYPTRLFSQDYAAIASQFDSTTDMFGSQAGFLNKYLDEDNAPEVVEKSEGSSSEQLAPLEYTHAYDPESLRKLARDSSHDLVSMKRSLRNAYPTFKLYLVEEDEFEDRYVAMDDFYAYNGVKEFTIVQSRKSPADHAIITLQNIDGTLDGSRRNAIIDVDYYARSGNLDESDQPAIDKLVDSGYDRVEAQVMGRSSPLTEGTADDQPFNAVVLRPGQNVQLRVGYSNDPRQLQVMISGRVVDLQWNTTGDLAELLVQSFGVELVQHVKGLGSANSDRVFYTTHELLGTLMLEPELGHFGRWEFGVLTQAGENKSHAYDFRDYSRDGYMNRLSWTHAWGRWISENPVTFAIGTAAAGLLAARFRGAGVFGRTLQGVTHGGLVGRLPIFGARRIGMQMSAASRLSRLSSGGVGIFEAAANAVRTGEGGAAIVSRVAPLGLLRQLDYVWRIGATTAGNVAVGLAVAEFGIDAAWYKLVGSQVHYYKKLWDAKKHTLFMSPRDDNLFPPHPKDYMLLLDEKWSWAGAGAGSAAGAVAGAVFPGGSLVGRVLGGLIGGGSGAPTAMARGVGDAIEALSAPLLGSDLAESFRSVWDMTADPQRLITKKVDPTAAQYVLDGVKIWDVFHEMSLRHPGWIYGVRPYGTRFEYRMFFGPPNQRYWAAPASNEFVDRMNRLYKWIGDDKNTSDAEFDALYGKGASKQIADDVYNYQDSIWQYENDAIWADPTLVQNDDLRYSTYSSKSLTTEQLESLANKERTSIAMREYLRGLNLRFVPFRRHHMITSDIDIIANGIMGTTNASYNAVDVRYYKDVRLDDAAGGAAKTTLVKAHTFLPDDQMRIHPIAYPNCRSYSMAVRYGVGQLLHDLREMYRGEILLRGNPRIRPWDICIMLDVYNDMVGPVEVEQVVHSFSHENGFLTEIKPSLVVMANEISTWPLLEGMKIFAMAVRDIENRYRGKGAGDSGFFGAAASVLNATTWPDLIKQRLGRTENYTSHIYDQYKKKFGDDGAQLEDFGIAVGIDPTQSAVGKVIDRFGTATTVAGALTSSAFLAGGGWGTWKAVSSGASAGWTPKALIGTGVLLGAATAAGAWTAYNFMDTPNIIWLLGGSNLFLQCLHNETIIAVPLMKNGTPMISGLATNDPEVMYKSFAGGVNQWIEDSVEGSRDLYQLGLRYLGSAWEAEEVWNLDAPSGTVVP